MANGKSVTEHQKLVPKDTIQVLGTEVSRNDRDWFYAIVFPIRVKGENDAQFDEVLPDPIAKWKEIFPAEDEDTIPKLKPNITWEVFTTEARQNVVKYLRNELGCEVSDFKSVDEDEIFVLFGMKDQKTLKKFAYEEEVRVRMKPEAYEKHKFQCPTDRKVGKVFEKLELTHKTLHGKDHFNDFPAFVRYTPEIDAIVEDVEDTEMLRCLRHALRKYCRIQLMEQAGVIRLFFPIHNWDHLEELYRRGWNNPGIPMYFPKPHMPDSVAEYFGAHVASYFHFYNTLSRWLIFPAILSIGVPIAREYLPTKEAHWLDSGFGLIMCMWTTFFLAHNKQSMNVKLLKWGMGGNVTSSVVVRKNFKDEKRGTWLEFFRVYFHWAIVIFFLVETIVVSRWIVEYRMQVLDDPEGITWGIPNKDMQKYFKYMITANIKVVEMIFTPLSIYLSKHENHRTEMELKSNMILKLFAVKFVVFYYPFIRPIFIQPYTEGCSGDAKYEGCLDDLRADLQLFFITQVISVVVGLCIQVALMIWTIRKEVQRKKSSDSMLSYVEVQAMLSDYDEEAEVSDYMQAVLNFGFLAMFASVAPSMCFLCFLSNLPMKRLLAYRFSYGQKRVIPIITVGIGSWGFILNFLAYLGVSCTTYIVVFAFNIFDFTTYSQELFTFLAIERGMAMVKFVIDMAAGEQSIEQARIEEYNDDVRDIIVANEIRRVSGSPRGPIGA